MRKILQKRSTKKSNRNIEVVSSGKTKVKITPFPIVAVGASAGGLSAFQDFFSGIPTKNGMAFILITHLDREHVSQMPEIIQKYTTMPVIPIKKKIAIAPDTVYVITPNSNLTIHKGILNLTAQIEPHYKNHPISYFFHLLGKDQKENAFAVILSGTGTDGSLGLREIKQHNGTVIAQHPKEAEYENMPQSAINTGLVDYVIPVKEIYALILKLTKNNPTQTRTTPVELQQIYILLQAHTGHDFSSYKLNTVYRRIERQMHLNQVKSLGEYILLLRKYPETLDSLFQDLLIGVTCFFRDPDAFDALKVRIMHILKDRSKTHPVRVWVPGCTTGEEVYSIAILFRECLLDLKKSLAIQIFGTDIDLRALEIARAAVYPQRIELEISSERLHKFFIKSNESYKLKKEIRQMVVFGAQNIISDPPFTKLDLISCRNLLIYLNSDLQKKLIPLFHHSLKPQGTLFLGFSEATSGCSELFNTISKKWKIFERKEMKYAIHTLMNFPTPSRLAEIYYPVFNKLSSHEDVTPIKGIQDFLNRNPTLHGIVVDKHGDIVYSHDKIVSKFFNKLKLKSNNIVEKVQTSLRLSLKTALREANTYQRRVVKSGIKIKYNNKVLHVTLSVLPLVIKPLHDLFIITIEKNPKSLPISKPKSNLKADKKIASLENELKYVKEDLEATIYELATSNEELQSTNEELQSTNEEIETSKEELQSLNEELIIVNTELQNRIDQLALVHDDMNNLFSSTEIAAFFLDNELRIKRFTPKAKELIHLLQSDIGRSIGHFATSLIDVDLLKDSQEVLATLMQKTIEVKSHNNKWFIIRILPYRTVANVIDGIVITFTDITPQKENESKLLQFNHSLNEILMLDEDILNTLSNILIVLNHDLQIIWANQPFYNLFMLTKETTIGSYIYDIQKLQLSSLKLRELLTNVLTLNNAFEGFEMKCDLRNVYKYNKLILNARRIFRRDSNDLILLGIIPE